MVWVRLLGDRRPKNFLGAYKDPRVGASVLGVDTETHL